MGELEAQRLADDVTLERREGEALAHWLPWPLGEVLALLHTLKEAEPVEACVYEPEAHALDVKTAVCD